MVNLLIEKDVKLIEKENLAAQDKVSALIQKIELIEHCAAPEISETETELRIPKVLADFLDKSFQTAV